MRDSLACALAVVVVTAAEGVAQDGVLTALFAADGPEERARAAEPLMAADVDFDELYTRLSSGPRYGAEVETGLLEWNRKGRGGRHEYVVLVPEDYDPAKAYPVRFYLHGGVRREARPKKGDTWWRRFDRLDGAQQISVFPAAWRDSSWWQLSQLENLREILDRLKTVYNVDENRVALYGVSDGGTGVYYHAMKAPTQWSTFLPFIGQPAVLSNPATGVEGEMFEVNLANKPLYVVNGESDRLYPSHAMAPFVEAFREAGAEVVFRSRAGGHNTRWWNSERTRLEGFLEAHPRVPHPERLVWETEDVERFGRVHWLVVDALGDAPISTGLFPHEKRSGRVVVERRGNAYTASSLGAARFRLLLSPAVVDFDEPVSVTVDGVTRFEGRVEPSIETLLRWYARDHDRTMLYGAEITVDVSGAERERAP